MEMTRSYSTVQENRITITITTSSYPIVHPVHRVQTRLLPEEAAIPHSAAKMVFVQIRQKTVVHHPLKMVAAAAAGADILY